MKAVQYLIASKDAVRSYKMPVGVSDTYGVASKKISVIKGTPVKAIKVATLILLTPFTSLHISVIMYSNLR